MTRRERECETIGKTDEALEEKKTEERLVDGGRENSKHTREMSSHNRKNDQLGARWPRLRQTVSRRAGEAGRIEPVPVYQGRRRSGQTPSTDHTLLRAGRQIKTDPSNTAARLQTVTEERRSAAAVCAQEVSS